jgi:hypothetical protein
LTGGTLGNWYRLQGILLRGTAVLIDGEPHLRANGTA